MENKIQCFIKPKGQKFVIVNSQTRTQQTEKTFSTQERAKDFADKNSIEIISDQLNLF